MIRQACVTVLIAVFYSTAFSQDFRPGFILKLSGDSISGFVANRSNKSNTEACLFKASDESNKTKYLPNELRGYGFIDNKYYESKEIRTGGKAEPVFAEALVKGKMSLYKYNNSFYLEKDSFFILSNQPMNIINVGTRQYNGPAKFKGILNYLMKDCGLHADKTPYEEQSLINLIQGFNSCAGSPGLIYKSKQPRIGLSSYVFSGIDISAVKLDGFGTYHFGQSLSIPVGIGADINSPKVSDKTNLSIELWYIRKFYQGYSNVDSSGTIIRGDFFVTASFLKMPIGVRYNFRTEAHTPYFKFGFVHYFVLNTSGIVLREAEANDVVSTLRMPVIMQNKAINGFWMGCGYSGRVIRGMSTFVEARYEINNGFVNPSSDSRSSGTTLNFLLGLKF